MMSNMAMTDQCSYNIQIAVETVYIQEQSVPEQDRYVFAYTITIRNAGIIAAKLMKRHWLITDSNNKIQEVRGEGVIGEQPHLLPGQTFTYTSGAILETPVGCMQGSYELITDDGIVFNTDIPVFRLSTPIALH